jgi:hypothetical protein
MAWTKNPLSSLWVALSDGTLASMTFRPAQQIVAWARHPIDGFVENIASMPSPSGQVDDLWLIVRRTIGGVTKRYVEYLAPPFEPSNDTDKALMGFVDSGLNYVGPAVSAVSGLFHLEGKIVQVCADGADHPDRTVVGGKITLAAPATNVWVGLGYTSRLRTLRPEKAAQETAQGKTKRSPRVTVRVINAMGGQCGPADENVMDPLLKDLDATLPTTPMFTGDTDVFIASDYDLDARLVILQSRPLPLDILAVMPLLTVSEG